MPAETRARPADPHWTGCHWDHHCDRGMDSPADMSTPRLVREFTAIKVRDVLEAPNGARHARLQPIVTELRLRGVLD